MSNTTKADLLMVLVTLLAAVSWIFSKEAVMQMPPLLFMGIRFLMAGALLALVGWRMMRRLTLDQCKRAVMVGLVFGIAMSFWVTGLHRGTHVGEGAFLTSLAVVLVPVIGTLVFRETPPSSTWLALPVAVAGLALLSLEHGFRPEAGQLYFVLAAAIFALYFSMNTQAANTQTLTTRDGAVQQREKVPVLALTAMVLLTVGVFTGALSLVLEPWAPTFERVSLELAGWVVASAVIGTAARFFVQTWAQSLSNHSHGVVILVIEPIWVALFAAAWFGETMSLQQLGGCALIFTALLVNRWGAVRKLLKAWL